MTKEEFLKDYDLSEELEEFLSSGNDQVWWYCSDDGDETFVVCHFYMDSIQEDTVVYEEYQITGLDTEEKWKELMAENDYILPKNMEVWPDGIESFVEYMDSNFTFNPPLMYDNNWVPDLSEEIEL